MYLKFFWHILLHASVFYYLSDIELYFFFIALFSITVLLRGII